MRRPVIHPAPLFGSLLVIASALALPDAPLRAPVGGRVVDERGAPAAGALVTARHEASGRAFTTYAGEDGGFAFPNLPEGDIVVEFRGSVADVTPRATRPADALTGAPTVTLAPATPDDEPPASAFLAQLPDGETKSRVIVDCGGCHAFNSTHARKEGRARTEAEWQEAIRRMVDMAGQGTGFPIISGQTDPTADARWFTDALAGAAWPVPDPWDASLYPESGAHLTEYDLPVPGDLPHDLVVDDDGRVVVTGMFTHQMYVLHAGTGEWSTVSIPVPNANPRAVDLDEQGRWWVLLGAPQSMAVYDPGTEAWADHAIGMYPHSIDLDDAGRTWFNGHFSVTPELVGVLDPGTGEVTPFEIPPTSDRARSESTIQYGLRIAADGNVWTTQLRGNHLVRLDPGDGSVTAYEMPTEESGPRRPDIGPDGTIWIPEFGANKLARFDPATESFTEYDFPVADAAPYVVRVDQNRGTVWIGTGHGDVVGSFDPGTERFTLYPLPTRGALIRHIDVDHRTGDLWAAYGAAPGPPAKILRIETG